MIERGSERIYARTWVLLALDACDRAGISPISKELFHRLIFLSNCLAEIFKATAPTKRVVKYKRGPFYPDVQWELDRLNAMGLLSIQDFRIVSDTHGPWMSASYAISSKGIEVSEGVRTTSTGLSTATYIDEMVFAFARMNSYGLDSLALRDLNYSAPGIANGALITFDDRIDNLAARKADEFVDLAPELLTSRIREQLHLYLRFIESKDQAA